MTDLRKAAQAVVERWDTPSWKDVPATAIYIEALRQALAQQEDTKCKDHPDAPHSFDRNASLTEDRYVCGCEYWEPPVDAVNMSQERVDETAKHKHELTDWEAVAQPEQYDQTALELCEKCGWKAVIPDEGCLVCARNEQEPVGYVTDSGASAYFLKGVDLDDDTPLYAAPPKREWVGLTDAERFYCNEYPVDDCCSDSILRAEAKLKEKNGA
jgi:hypothetical protein